MSKKAKTYHIIGAGIAGLSAAMFAKRKNSRNKIIIYEAAPHLGGRCYSFEDKELGCPIDNATHVVLGANKNAVRLFKSMRFQNRPLFWDTVTEKICGRISEITKNIMTSACNTNYREISPKIRRKILCKLFPFTSGKTRTYFSRNDLSQTFIAPLSEYADEIKTGYVLKGFAENRHKITELFFNKETVTLSADDIVITAIAPRSYQKLFNGPDFEFNEITNIIYKTSQPITLAGEQKMLGMLNGFSHWIFINDNIVNVTISDSAGLRLEDDNLARNVWREIRRTREQNAAFLPQYKIIRHKYATIKQDETNNKKRPKNSKTQYKNMFIAGDWTLKNYPCCIEAAIISAKRAVNAAS